MCGIVTIYPYHKKLASVSPGAHDGLGSWPFQDSVLGKGGQSLHSSPCLFSYNTLPSIHE